MGRRLLVLSVLFFATSRPLHALPGDIDSDGMPDAWETFFGLDPNNPADATADPDGDGRSNLQEFLTHGHPFGTFKRYFAEGATNFFDTSIGLVNLSTTSTAHVQLAFLTDTGTVTTHQVALAAGQRQTVDVDAVLAPFNGTIATIVESDVRIGADRLMKWSASGHGRHRFRRRRAEHELVSRRRGVGALPDVLPAAQSEHGPRERDGEVPARDRRTDHEDVHRGAAAPRDHPHQHGGRGAADHVVRRRHHGERADRRRTIDVLRFVPAVERGHRRIRGAGHRHTVDVRRKHQRPVLRRVRVARQPLGDADGDGDADVSSDRWIDVEQELHGRARTAAHDLVEPRSDHRSDARTAGECDVLDDDRFDAADRGRSTMWWRTTRSGTKATPVTAPRRMGYKGQPILTPFTIHPCNLRGGDVFGAYQGAALARELRAPVVLLLNDLWMLKNYMSAFAPVREEVGTRVVAYCPLDGRLPETSWMAPLDQIDRFVAYTQFGRDEFTRAAEQLTAAGTRFAFPEIDVIPHGVDTTTFHPIAGGRREARARLRPDRPELLGDDTFIVLNANRPMPRKRIDLTIDGFARFARNKPPHVRLCLHQAIGYGDERAKVAGWIEAAGLTDRVLVTADAAPDGVTSDERLNLIYNACDVGVNTAMGEGWGLISMEHAATRAAQIVPRHSACEEIWTAGETGDDAALFLDPIERGVPSFSLLEFATVSVAQLAEALDRLYADRCLLHHLAAGAYGVATRPGYTWDAIADRWVNLFRVLLTTTGGGTAWTRL